MSDTPRTDEAWMYDSDNIKTVGVEFACQLERELNRACEMYRKLDIHALNLVDRIRRLEEAGDRMEKLLPEGSICDKAVEVWTKAKEAKP